MYPSALMPDVDELGHHLFEYFEEFDDINWTEMKNWSGTTGNYLSGWEAGTLIRMQRAYKGMIQKAEGKDIDAPFAISVNARREQVYNSFKSILESARNG